RMSSTKGGPGLCLFHVHSLIRLEFGNSEQEARRFVVGATSRATSCRLRRYGQATRIRPTPTSMPPCRATSAAAGPICASVKQSGRLLNSHDRRHHGHSSFPDPFKTRQERRGD